MRRLGRWAPMAAAVALAAQPLIAAAQPAAAPPPASGSPVEQARAPMPGNVAQLDAALAAKDYARVNRIHGEIRSGDELLLLMNWEQVRIFNGEGGFYLSQLYMHDLWAMASALEAAHRPEAADMKQTAVLIGLYSYELVVLDGTKCTDSTAVGHRMDQLTGGNAEAWAYIPQIPEDMRAKMVWAALQIESHTASVRKNDDVLCQGGLTQMIAGLGEAARTGQAPREVPNQPGMVGRSYAVAPPKDFQIGYASPDVWRPAQAKLRESMPARLSGIMKVKGPYVPPKS